jgi:uncharacterized protein YkwD
MWFGLLCIFALSACSQKTPIQPGVTATVLKAPQVLTQVITRTPNSTQGVSTQGISTQGMETPSPLPTLADTAFPAEKATATPTVSPTEAPAQATPTTAPTETPAQATPTRVPSEVPTEAAANATEAAGGCIDKAAFYGDISIPDNTPFKQDTNFTKTWQISNEGTCVWDGYHLIFAGGDLMNAKLSSPMPVVKPGELANISVDLKSPSQGGLFTGLWEFESKDGKRFGVNSTGQDLIWVKISVTWYTAAGLTKDAENKAEAASPNASGPCAYQPNPDYEKQVLQLINQARAQKSLPALNLRGGLSAAALAHSVDMACNNFADHTGSDGSSWYTRIQAQNYIYSYATENIFYGDPSFIGDPEGAFKWWMGSPIHHDNIMNPKVTSFGIGYAFFSNSDYKGYYTIDFARP